MSDASDKVMQIFRELVGERASKLNGSHFPADINSRITQALAGGEDAASDERISRNDGIGFHLVDWQSDAAFLVALVLFPERFTDEEIRDGVDGFLWHVPAHVLEAARLGGYPTKNIFAEPDATDDNVV
jgi:hypothetical protein